MSSLETISNKVDEVSAMLDEMAKRSEPVKNGRPMKGTVYYFLDDVNDINKTEWSNCMRDDKRLKANNVHLTIASVQAEQEKRDD